MSKVRDMNMNFEDFTDSVRMMSNTTDFNNLSREEIKARVDKAFDTCMGRPIKSTVDGNLMGSINYARPTV